MEYIDTAIALINKNTQFFNIVIDPSDKIEKFNASSILPLQHFYDVYLTRYKWLGISSTDVEVRHEIKLFLDNMDRYKNEITNVRLIVMTINHKLLYVYSNEEVNILLGVIGLADKQQVKL